MFIRQKKNKSGKVSVQVIDKTAGKYKVKKTIGCSADRCHINNLVKEGEVFIKRYLGQLSLDFFWGDDDQYFQSIYDNIEQVQLLGPELVLGKIFKPKFCSRII